jgi:hypothetical protein
MCRLRTVCPLYRKQLKRGELMRWSLGDAPGPKMTAFHSMMLSGHGLPEMPPGGSLESRLKSRIRRLLQLVDYNQTSCESQFHGRNRQNEQTMTVVIGEVKVWSLGTAAFLPCVSTRDWSAQYHVNIFCFTKCFPRGVAL